MQYTLPVRAACFEWKCWDVRGQPQAVEAAVPGAGLQPREAAPGLHLGEDVHTGGCRHSADKLSVEPRHLLHDLHLSHLDVHGGKGGSSLLEDPHFVVFLFFWISTNTAESLTTKLQSGAETTKRHKTELNQCGRLFAAEILD